MSFLSKGVLAQQMGRVKSRKTQESSKKKVKDAVNNTTKDAVNDKVNNSASAPLLL